MNLSKENRIGCEFHPGIVMAVGAVHRTAAGCDSVIEVATRLQCGAAGMAAKRGLLAATAYWKSIRHSPIV